MNERLAELKQLWARHFDAELTPAENARLAELMNDEALMEAFAADQASRAEGEPLTGMNEAQWAALDSRITRAFRSRKLSLRFKPLAILLGSGLLIAGGLNWFGSSRPSGRPNLGLEGESFGVAKSAPRQERPQASSESDSSHQVRAAKISVVVEQPKNGPASVDIFSSAGEPVRSLFGGELKAGKHRFEWNGLDDQGRKASPGRYKIEIQSAAGKETRQLEIRRKNNPE